MGIRFLVDHPSEDETWELDRDEAAELWKELGSCLGKDAQPQVTLNPVFHPSDPAASMIYPGAGIQLPHAVATPAIMPEAAVSPEEAMAAAAQAMSQAPARHTVEPSEPRGSAIGTRHVPRT